MPMPPTEPSPAVTGPKDVFLHLLAIIGLAFTATHVGVLGFQFVNRLLPDPLGPPFETGPLRWALATLVVVFPVYLWATRTIERECSQVTAKRRLRTRRWIIHATLFAAAVTIIGDLVGIVYQYLSGELTLRFLAKAVVIIAIAAVILSYYRLVLRRDADATAAPTWLPMLTRGTIVAVAIAMVGGFILAGSPGRERLRRFDRERVAHLQNILWRVVDHWQRTGALPAATTDLRDPIAGYTPPQDPERGVAYEYRVIDAERFELCATFATDTTTGPAVALPTRPLPIPVDDDAWEGWRHGVGRACFTHRIDPSRYPPRGSSDTSQVPGKAAPLPSNSIG